MNNRYVAIEGNIGAGKTTLAKLLSQKMNARLMLEEFTDNPFLASFYSNRERYAFSVEMSFLADRYHQMGRYNKEDLFQPLLLSDYSIYKSLIFAQNNLHGNELQLYRNFFQIVSGQLKTPDLILFLNRSYESLHRHIEKRGRSYEQQIEPEYLMNIQTNYIRFFKQMQDVTVAVVDADKYDILRSKADLEVLEDIISQKFKPGLNFLD